MCQVIVYINYVCNIEEFINWVVKSSMWFSSVGVIGFKMACVIIIKVQLESLFVIVCGILVFVFLKVVVSQVVIWYIYVLGNDIVIRGDRAIREQINWVNVCISIGDKVRSSVIYCIINFIKVCCSWLKDYKVRSWFFIYSLAFKVFK